MENTVEVSRVSKSFNGQFVVNDISFGILPGEVFGLIGPNGTGKTTIIRMLLDIIRPDSGILIASVVGVIEMSSRIFRATLLMYGKNQP